MKVGRGCCVCCEEGKLLHKKAMEIESDTITENKTPCRDGLLIITAEWKQDTKAESG